MPGAIQVFGEFHLSNTLARRMERAVAEILEQNTVADLSHVGDDCALCRRTSFAETLRRAASADSGPRTPDSGLQEVRHDAPEANRSRDQWIA